MVRAIYRHRNSNTDLELTQPGTVLDFAALDLAALKRWGIGLVRIASWIV